MEKTEDPFAGVMASVNSQVIDKLKPALKNGKKVAANGQTMETAETSSSSPANEAEDLKRRVKLQEKMVREHLGQNLKKIREESRKLTLVQKALESLEKEQQKDIDILRTSESYLLSSMSQSYFI